MALNFWITNAVAQAVVTAVAAAIDAGTAAIMEIYDGTQPADADTAIGAQVKLATLTFSATAFGAASDANPGGRIAAATITSDSSADATGTASWFVIRTQAAGTICAMGSVGTGTNDLVMNTVAFTAGSAIGVSAFTITMPEG